MPGFDSDIPHLVCIYTAAGIYVSEAEGKNVLLKSARMPVFPVIARSQDFFVPLQNTTYLLLLASILVLVIILLLRTRSIRQSTIPTTRSVPDKCFEPSSLPSNQSKLPPYPPPRQYAAPFTLPRPHQPTLVKPQTPPPDPTIRRHSSMPTPSPSEKDGIVLSKSQTIETPTWKRSDRVVKKNGWRRHTLNFAGLQSAGGFGASAIEHDGSSEYPPG